MAVLLGIVISLGLGAQNGNSSIYRLVIIDRTKCPGAVVRIDEPLTVFAHGATGYYIIFGRGDVTIPAGAKILVDYTSKIPSGIYEYLETRAFQRYVSSPKVLEGLRFAVQAAGK